MAPMSPMISPPNAPGPLMNGQDYMGMPNYMPFTAPNSPGVTNANSDYTNMLAQIMRNYDTSGTTAFRNQAMRKGPSTWATLADAQQNAESANARERGAQEVAGQTAQGDSALAAQGGLSSGARERVAEGGAKNYMNMSQDIARQNNLNKMQIGVNDEQNRIQQLGMLPGIEAQTIAPEMNAANAWEGAAQNEAGQLNNYNMSAYTAQMQAWAAAQQADATAHSGKKGGGGK